MYKMGNFTDENNGTIIVKDADGNEIQVRGTFEVTGATEKGVVSFDFTPATGAAAGVSIPFNGTAKLDGSITLDLKVSDGASFGLLASSAVVMAADPGLTADVAALAKAVKADAKALRAQRLAIQEEVAAKTGAKTALRNVAAKVETLSGLLPGNSTIVAASDNLSALAALERDDLETYTVEAAIDAAIDAAGAAEEAALSAPQTAAVLSAEVTELNQQIIELRNVSSAKTKAKTIKGAATKTVTKTKKVVKKAADKLRKVK